MLLLHRLSRRQHPFSSAPWMDFSFEQTSFDDGIVLSQLGSLLWSHPENGASPQLALFAERKRSGNGHVSLICHLVEESGMLLHHVHELRRVWVPMVAALHQNNRILLESGRLGRIVNGARFDEPRPMNLSGQAACSDRGIAVGPPQHLRRRVRLEHKDATQYRVVHEWPSDHKFVFSRHLADVGYVLFLKLFTRFFAQLRSIGRTIQQYEEVLGGLGIRLVLGLRDSRGCNREVGFGLGSLNLGHQNVANVVPVWDQLESRLCVLVGGLQIRRGSVQIRPGEIHQQLGFSPRGLQWINHTALLVADCFQSFVVNFKRLVLTPSPFWRRRPTNGAEYPKEPRIVWGC